MSFAEKLHGVNRVKYIRNSKPRSGILRDGVNYYKELSMHAPIPVRDWINPGAIIPLLPYVSLLDVVDEGGERDFRVSLIGEAIRYNGGIDFAGRHISQIAHLGAGTRFWAALHWAMRTGRPAYLELDYSGRESQTVYFECYVAPLSYDRRTVTSFMLFADYIPAEYAMNVSSNDCPASPAAEAAAR